MMRFTRLSVAAMLMAPLALAAQTPAPPTVKPTAKASGLLTEAKVSEAAARVTALKAVPGGVVKGHELEKGDGKLIWSFDITVAGKSGIEEVHIDAITGKMLKHEHETPAHEKKEAAEDAAKAKAAAGAKKP